MESFPHRYRVKGRALSDTDVSLVTEGAPGNFVCSASSVWWFQRKVIA